jgi:hypothetical protein
VGLATGDQPSTLAWLGIAVAFPAIYLVPQADARHDPAIDAAAARSDGAGYGVIAGLGFGTLFALVGQIGDDAGFFPLALLQLTVAATVVVIATSLRQPWVPRGRGLAPVFAFGLLGSAALVFFQLATQQGLHDRLGDRRPLPGHHRRDGRNPSRRDDRPAAVGRARPGGHRGRPGRRGVAGASLGLLAGGALSGRRPASRA